jgi:ADP-ribose pyrophosphatase YjhB (NUDIX family)
VARRHPIQQSVLETLRGAPDGLRYARMKPADVENDLYNYHLQYLLKQGLVAKQSEHYVLTTDGKKYLVDLNPLDEQGESSRFKMASLCVLTRETAKGVDFLCQRRARQPFAGEQGFIGGGIWRGELAADAAARRLREEAGLVAEFKHVGLIRKIRFDASGELYSDILFHLCFSDTYSGRLVHKNKYGEHEWVSLAHVIHLEQTRATGSKQLAALLKQYKTTDLSQMRQFYFEELYRADIY